jgi:hypothetical protein
VTKPYRELTAAERVAARIAQNRKIEQSLAREPLAHGLAGIVARLHERKQRAYYGAVADVLGVLPRGLMTGRPKCHQYSWVVAATGSERGWPTDYSENQIDPECLRQIRADEDEIIEDAESLRVWLQQ